MLMDKTGLRKKGSEKKSIKGKFKTDKGKMTQDEKDKMNHDRGVQMALKFGVGYEQYKKEVDAIRAERLRIKLEEQNNGAE